MLTSARITLKQHRFEIGAAALIALVVGASAWLVTYRLNAIALPPGCLNGWLHGAAGLTSDCVRAASTWASIDDNEATKIFAAMQVVPFAVGLIGGVPLVARELETGTAQTAWFLWGSRLRWLTRQLLPVLVILGLATAVAGVAMSALETTQVNNTLVDHLTLQGPIVVARALAGLGLGVLLGAVLGRTMPAFVVGILVCVILAAAAVPLRIDWLDAHKEVLGDIQSSGYSFGILWRSPDGALVGYDDAVSFVPQGIEDPDTWLFDHRWTLVQLGVTDETTRSWTPYEVGLFSAIGLAAVAAAGVAVDRRRPT